MEVGNHTPIVSIAFRRSATWLRETKLAGPRLNTTKSPLPFGVLPPGYFLPILLIKSVLGLVSIAFRRSATWLLDRGVRQENADHAVSIAFRRSATWLHSINIVMESPAPIPSPLPFGVLPPGYLK